MPYYTISPHWYIVNEIFERMGRDEEKVTYGKIGLVPRCVCPIGINEVERAGEMEGVEKLLLCDDMLRSELGSCYSICHTLPLLLYSDFGMRARLARIHDLTSSHGGSVHVISSSHDAGQQLNQVASEITFTSYVHPIV